MCNQSVMRARHHLITALPLLGMLSASPLQAQIEEIVVTAQKREQNLQDVPISVQAFGSEQLEKLGWGDVAKLDEQVSGMFFGDMSANRPRVFLRGIGTTKFDIGAETAVAVFVDDVYIPRFSSILSGLVDVERIEVLKGPQGTLYGRNVTGGAIKIVNKAPTEDFEGFFEAGIGNFSLGEVKGAVSGSLLPNRMLGRLAISHRSQDGPHEDTVTGNSNGAVDTVARGALSFIVSDDLNVGVGVSYIRQDAEGQMFDWKPNPTNPLVFLNSPLKSAAVQAALPGVTSDQRSDAYNLPGFIDQEGITATVKINWTLDDFQLVSITSYIDDEMQSAEDFDATSFEAQHAFVDQQSAVFSHELRLASLPGGLLSFDNRLNWQLGVYYFRDDSEREDKFIRGEDGLFAAIAGGLGSVPPFSVMPVAITDVFDVEIETTSTALFGQGTFDVTDKLALTLGLRYTEDKKDMRYDATTSAIAVPPVPVPFTLTDDLEFSATDYRFAVDYHFLDNLMGYASYSRGFKSGGVQSSVGVASAALPFDEEVLKALEFGFKSRWLDNHVQLNVSAFRYVYEDQQVLTSLLVGGTPVPITDNVASSTMYGAEMDAAVFISEQLAITANYSYLDATYDEYLQAATGADLSGNQMIYTPEHSYNLGVSYLMPLGEFGELDLRADYSWKDNVYYDVDNTRDLGEQNAQGVINLSGSLSWGDNGRYALTVFCNNCADKDYSVNKLVLPNPGVLGGGVAGAAISMARGLEFGARFRVNI